MVSINRRKLSDIALDLGKKRRKKDAQTASINDEGWELLDLAKNSLFMLDSVKETSPGAIIKLPQKSSASTIFKTMLTPELVDRILGRLQIEHRAWFVRSKGGGKYKMLNPTVEDVYKALALEFGCIGRSLCTSRTSRTCLKRSMYSPPSALSQQSGCAFV